MILNLQDILRFCTRYIKYWKLSLLCFCLAAVAFLSMLVYGSPVYYSSSEVEYQFVDLPIRSETSDLREKNDRYNNIQFILQTGLTSAWLKERTALKLGAIQSLAQYDEVTSKVLPNLKVTQFVGNLIRIEAWTYRPELARIWPVAMLEEYRSFLTEQRTKRREQLVASFTDEMKRIRTKIMEEQANEQTFEAENQILEKYINQNRLEQLPSELLTIRTRMDAMNEMEKYMTDTAKTVVEKLALYKKYRTMPLPVGTLVRIGQKDRMMVKKSAATVVPGAASGDVNGDSNQNNNSNAAVGTQQVIVVPESAQSAEVWEEISRELRGVTDERDRAALRLLPAHQEMRRLNSRVAELESGLAKELERNQEAFRLEKAYLFDQLNQLESSLPEYRRLVSDYDTYKRDFSLLTSGKVAWEQAYAALKEKLTAMDYTGQEPRVNFKFNGFVEVRDDLPVAPNKRKLLTYALVLGFGLALGAPVLIDRLRFTTSIAQEAEKITGLTALGIVPHIPGFTRQRKSGTESATDIWPDRNVQECFRMLRSQISIQNKNAKAGKVLMVVSCRAGEGKSTVASFLAASLASANIKTLIIDADLRRGRLSSRLGLAKGLPGISELFHGCVTNPQSIVYNVSPNLDMIPRGSADLKMEDFLSDSRLVSLITYWSQNYQMVIVDTTPVLGIADPLEISRAVDSTLLVIRAEDTTHRDMITVRDQLLRAEMNIVGFVLNDVDMSKMENSYYYYTYYNRYYGSYYDDDAQGLRARKDHQKLPS